MIPVTLIIIDGLRPDAIRQARCPSLDWLRFNGSTSFKAHSVMPCYTLPCHTSIFYSTLPATAWRADQSMDAAAVCRGAACSM